MKKEEKGTAKSRVGLEEGSKKFELSRKAQAANKRLLQLEREDMTKYAYAVAEKYFEDKGRTSNRFKENVKRLSEEEVEEELKAVDRFLNSASSSPARIKQIEEKKENKSKEALNKLFQNKFKRDLTDSEYKQMVKFFENEKVKSKLFSKFASSEQAIQTIFGKGSKTQRERLYSVLSNAEISEGVGSVKILVGKKSDAKFLENLFQKKLFETTDYSPAIKSEDVAPAKENIQKRRTKK